MGSEVAKSPKDSGIFGFIRDAFVESTPDAAAPAGAPAAVPPPAPGVTNVPTGNGTFIPVRAATEPDAKALAKIESALAAVRPPVYAAFIEQYDALAEDIPDEAVRFKVALKTSKATVEQLVQAFDVLDGALSQAFTEFAKSFEAKKAKALETAQQSLTDTDALLTSKIEQLSVLEGEIVLLRTKRTTDAEQIQNDGRRIEGIRLGFVAAHQQVSERLKTQRARIAPRG